MWTVVLAAIWLFVEGTGLPLLSEGAYGPLGAAVHNGSIGIWQAYAVAYVATVSGNTIGFLTFSAWGPRLETWLSHRWPKVHALLQRTEPSARKHIFWAITLSRFVGLGTFGIVLWLAGIIRAPWKWFLPWLFVLDLAWNAMWLFGSTWLVKWVMTTFNPDSPGEIIGIIAGAVLLALFLHFGISRVGSWFRRSPSVGE